MTDYSDQLKKYWRAESLSFIATFKRYKQDEGFFNHFINPLTRKELFYPELDGLLLIDKRMSFYKPNVPDLIDGHYYRVDLKYNKKANRKKNPYSLQITSITDLNQEIVKNHLKGSLNKDFLIKDFQIKSIIERDKAKEHIRLRFERLNNPEANRIIANLLREVGKGMYSSKQRMIFELLQNADDSPGKEDVEFHIDASGDYFFVMHDGAPFNKDDVDAITSAAESTKRKDKRKTGYKGIGFKSVFTDSTEVWVKSGNYQFAFLKESELFKDFESFYFSFSDYTEFPGLIDKHRKKYQNDILVYNSLTDIPWQIIPIWQDELPDDLPTNTFNKFDNPVQFALKVGSNNVYSEDGYLSAIDNIVKRPQFLLFLRNVSKFRSPKNKVTVLRRDEENIIHIEKIRVEYHENQSQQKKESLKYIKQTYSDIPVNDKTFTETGIGLRKHSRTNDYGETTYYFTDYEGKEIDTIPPKLAASTETEISFGISFVENKISPEEDYIKGLLKYSSLFTYLPMEDNRFQLPFLVNADFVPSSDRQKIQGDNLWNKYIMIQVAEKHVETLAYFAKEFIKDNNTYSSYLSLLLKRILPDDDTAQQIIDNYNTTYIESLKCTEIVVNDENKIQLVSDTIVDDSGLVELFGYEIFYEIIKTEKKLPHPNLDATYLKEYKYLEVETIKLEELAGWITGDICEKLSEIIAKKQLYEDSKLLGWLDKLVEYIPENFGNICFIAVERTLFSLNLLIQEPDVWLINENTSDHVSLIQDLGYYPVEINLEKYANIRRYIGGLDCYVNNNLSAYNRIAETDLLPSLSIASKIELIDFLQNCEFMKGVGETKYFGELRLFVDQDGIARPLQNLICNTADIDVESLHKFKIAKDEFDSLSDESKKKLISKEKLFTSFFLNEVLFEEWSQQFNSKSITTYVEDLKKIYNWIEHPDKITASEWASIPWLYVDEERRFVTPEKTYWSQAFNKLSHEKYDLIKELFHDFEVKTLPLQECGALISAFPIKTDDVIGVDWTRIQELEMEQANILLDWMEADGAFSDFFIDYKLTANDNGKYTIDRNENEYIFDGSDEALKTYMSSNPELNLLFIELDRDLCDINRSKIGLLQGDQLIKLIIESGVYDQKLAEILPKNLTFKLLNDFICNLNELELFTDCEYSRDTPEHIILSRIIKEIDSIQEISSDVQNVINLLRSKISIDGNPLSRYTTNERVFFGTKEERKILNLSDILTEFQGESDVLDMVKESFSAITRKRVLRELIFKTEPLSSDEIHLKIESEPGDFYTVQQVVFHMFHKKYGGRNKRRQKKRFDEYYIENKLKKQLHIAYKELLDTLFELSFVELGDFKFQDLNILNCVDKNYAIEMEYLPDWLEEWVNIDQVERLDFLSKLGYNDANSAVVNLRKSMIAKDCDSNLLIRYFEESKPNMQIIWNSIIWLSNYKPDVITKNISIIKQINKYIKFRRDSVKRLTIPIIESIGLENKRRYTLQAVDVESKLLKINSQEHAPLIFSVLKDQTENAVFIDDNIDGLLNYLNVEVIELDEFIDSNVLVSNSKLWDEPFYRKWEHYKEYPIYIYDGKEIPFVRSYNNITINKFTRDLKDSVDGKYYISKILKKDVLNNLPDNFPRDMLTSLKGWHYRTLYDESLLDEDSFEYKENIDRLLQNRLGLSEDDQKQESGNAKTHAVYFLDENNFDISNIVDAGSVLSNIIDPEGNRISCIVRSAKGGLLYLDKDHWEMLEDETMHLIVIYPGNKPRIFKNRLELLEEEMAENVLFRIPNNKLTDEIDSVFDVLKSESHLILVTGEKMKESLFSKLRQNREFDGEENVAIGGEDFTV